LTTKRTGSSAAQVIADLRRTEFPWADETTYLNNASIGPLPERTRRVLDEFSAMRAAPHRLPDSLLMDGLMEARVTVSRLLNAKVSEVGLATNTSYGLNVASLSLPVMSGETVLISDKEFPANVYPWLMLRDRGVAVELAPTLANGWPDEGFLLERLRDPSVRVLAVSFVQFSNGYRVDLARLSEACRANGTFLVVDAIQGLGQCPLDVRKTPIDLLACGAQKWLLGPWGSGFLYVRQELLSELQPCVAGWLAFEDTDDFTRLTEYNPTFRSDARRFELATLPFQDFVGMTESLGLLLELDVGWISEYLRDIRRPLVEASEAGVLELTSPVSPRHDSAIVCVRTPDLEVATRALRAAGVVCVVREGSIRLSPHVFNTVEEIERVVAVLQGTQ
jgi:selenocysteine lyase/cysteine desulfurase